MAAAAVSKGEVEFALQALRSESVRVDGRALTAPRRCALKFGAEHGEVEVTYGSSRALAICSGEIVTPAPERPNEGRLSFHVDFGPIASPSFDLGRPSPQATTVANFIERLLKGSRAVDAEALCIVGGQKVWSIRVDIRALDDDGNLADVSAIAALCALMHFRKADVDVSGETARVYTAEERVPVPLSIHHLPVPVSFALFRGSKKNADETLWILDPTRTEEAAMAGALCVAVNQHGEICGIHKPGGLPVDISIIQHCSEIAVARTRELIQSIRSELDADLAKRAESRRNVHRQFSEAQLLTVDWSSPAAAADDAQARASPRLSARASPRVSAQASPRVSARASPRVSAKASPRVSPRAAPAAAAAAAPALAQVKDEEGETDAATKRKGRRRRRSGAADSAADSGGVLSAGAAAVAAQLGPACDLAAELKAVAEEKAELERRLAAAEASLQAADDAHAEQETASAARSGKKKKLKKKATAAAHVDLQDAVPPAVESPAKKKKGKRKAAAALL